MLLRARIGPNTKPGAPENTKRIPGGLEQISAMMKWNSAQETEGGGGRGEGEI